jgi:predicted amidohydrolase
VDRITVACVQQRLRLPQTLDEHRNDLRRFARAAQNKQARLLIFPELSGLLVGVPLLADFRASLLLRADQGRRRRATFWQRMSGAAAERMARVMQADLRATLSGLLDVHGEELWESYADVFGGLARETGMTVVAPSAYLPDRFDGVIRNLSAVFGPDGALLGTQAKLMLHQEDRDLVQPGTTLNVIPTEVGRIGLMLGNDMLYPEIGRLLAYQEAEMLVGQAASATTSLYNKLRAAMLARMQDNQLFSAISFLVGHNDFGRNSRDPFVGKSAILAPQDLTPRFSGVLVEMGNQRSEGVLTAEWDFVALRELWDSSDTPVRKQLPLGQAGEIVAGLYARLRSLPDGESGNALPDAEVEAVEETMNAQQRWMHLDDLPIFASVTRRWPLEDEYYADAQVLSPLSSATSATDVEDETPIRTEDETDEMDALPQRPENDS